MRYFLTGDYHLGHANIIRFAKRPQYREEDFQNGNWINKEVKLERCLEMNEFIIKRHNERVNEDDIIIHNGDFCFTDLFDSDGIRIKPIDYIKRFNGTFIFITGNHEKNNSLNSRIQSLQIEYSKKFFNIVHNPRFINYDYRINLTAHVHKVWQFNQFNKNNPIGAYGEPIPNDVLWNNNLEYITDCINIGIDVWNYYPVTFDEILKKFYRWKNEKGVDDAKE